ncbi:MAG: phosphate signaling complex protein PhoU [Phycisphaerales bacterium]|nr:phosphate signaling complex protein PhoU [Phycisphaerales bacterium]
MSTQFLQMLDVLRRRSLRMASAVEDVLSEAFEALTRVDHGLARRVIDRDAEIDREEVEVEAEVIRLITLFQPMGADIRFLCTVLKVNNDLERIADCAVNIAERVMHLDPALDREPDEDIRNICPVIQRMLRRVVQAYAASDVAEAREIRGEDEIVDIFYGEFIRKMVTQAAEAPERMATHLDILSVAKNLERIADHATNIAEDVIFLTTGQIVRHGRADG